MEEILIIKWYKLNVIIFLTVILLFHGCECATETDVVTNTTTTENVTDTILTTTDSEIGRDIYMIFNESGADEELNLYIEQITKAAKDVVDYSKLIGILQTPGGRAIWYYQKHGIYPYKHEFLRYTYYNIHLRVDPCRLKDNDYCCEGANEAACEDYEDIMGGTDLAVAWVVNGYIPQCENDFKGIEECGTYLEIHRPAITDVVAQTKIETYMKSGYKMEFISTKELCAGKYEIWFVVRSRSGRILLQVKPVYSEGPTCSCTVVKAAGFPCEEETADLSSNTDTENLTSTET